MWGNQWSIGTASMLGHWLDKSGHFARFLLIMDDLGNAMPDSGSKAAQATGARAANKTQVGVNPTNDNIVCLVRVPVGNAAYCDSGLDSCAEMPG